MKHLSIIINHKQKKKCIDLRISNGGHNQKRIAYFMGGYWFCLTRIQWSLLLCVNYNTIVGRCKSKKPVAQILGFEPLDSNKGRKCKPYKEKKTFNRKL